MHNPCALIPVYNHEAAVPAVVRSLLNSGLPCLLVDDGSSPACAAVLAQLATLDTVSLLTLPANHGKRPAFMAGFREAARLGQEVDQTADDIKLKVIEPPRVPLKPTGPDRPKFVSFVLIGALGVGVALSFLLSQLNPRFQDLQQNLQL